MQHNNIKAPLQLYPQLLCILTTTEANQTLSTVIIHACTVFDANNLATHMCY